MQHILKKALIIIFLYSSLNNIYANDFPTRNNSGNENLRTRIDHLAGLIQNSVYYSNAGDNRLKKVRSALKQALNLLRQQGDDGRPKYCAKIYQHQNYKGKKRIVNPGGQINNLSDFNDWNDAISSVKVAPGCRINLFQHSHFRGLSNLYTYSTPNVGAYNNAFSSLTCRCY